jgi:hypothetical protein
MSSEFQNSIKEWVYLDNKIKSYANEIKQLREQKNNVETEIHDFVETNDLSSKTIRISDSSLTFRKVKKQSGLTLKYIQECLEKCISNKEHIEIIMNTIKNDRSVSYVDEIKRTLDN